MACRGKSARRSGLDGAGFRIRLVALIALAGAPPPDEETLRKRREKNRLIYENLTNKRPPKFRPPGL
jgi:hypothetical protein